MGPSPVGDDTGEAGLLRVLGRSRELGLLGDGPLETHLANAGLFLTALEGIAPVSDDVDGPAAVRVLDLGSGGGVPGLVVAVRRPDLGVTLVDSQRRRCEFLRQAVSGLDLADRVAVAEGRAEDLARTPDLRGRFKVVTARSFGPPAVTAECAVGFLDAIGSVVLVSEPPGAGSSDRWPPAGLARLGLVPDRRVERPGVGAVQILVLDSAPDEAFPRRSGVPGKRPLF